ncbi:MFS transporter [Agrobacterium leguminum]|uniref:MFS transporter n=1 Tax=Agrobacterium leguminum TaxID=2792015 RepID=UPI003CE5695B
MSSMKSRNATVALIFGHIAGMIDLAALPVWVGTLSVGFGLGNTQAGGLVTAFLIGVVLASLVVARVFHTLPGHLVAPVGYGCSAACLFAMSQLEPAFGTFLMLHALAGIATGAVLSTTHGTMGRTDNPLRIFALGSAGFGVFALVFLGTAPAVVAHSGPATFFVIVAAIMAIAAFVTLVFFPRERSAPGHAPATAPIPADVWLVIVGVMLMNFVQALTFSYVERIGMARGYAEGEVQLVLLSIGIVNMFPALVAAALQGHLPPLKVGIAGAIVQALLSILITGPDAFLLYAIPSLFLAAVMIFTHTFLFGFLAKADPSARATAATPAMTMSGSAIAPLLGGLLSDMIGYEAIGFTAALAACVTVTLFARANSSVLPAGRANSSTT